VKSKRSLNFGDGLAAILGTAGTNETQSLLQNGILQFFVKNC